MKTQRSWICDGVPKNGQQYPNCSGPHPPHENYSTDCEMCGLPREALEEVKTAWGSSKTVLSGVTSQKSSSSPFPMILLLVILLCGGVAGFWFLHRSQEISTQETPKIESPKVKVTTDNPLALVSETAANSQRISQGEKVLFTEGNNVQQKTAAASIFAQKKWEDAIQQYQQAANADPNDPEAKIYLNNAQAKKSGKLVTMAVVVPITSSVNEAKEVLRGVAQYQDEFNRTLPNYLLEVVIVNEEQSSLGDSISQDLIQSPVNVLGVLGHGVDNNSRQALSRYEKNNLAALSTLNTAIAANDQGESVVKTIPLSQTSALLGTYLKKVGETLVNYAVKNQSPAAVTIFYNSDSPYSQQLKTEFVAALAKTNGKVVKEVDITASDFNANNAIDAAVESGTNTGFLALSKNKVDTAIAIAKANKNQLTLLGGDELYNPTILVQGDDSINGMVLAVPWQWQENNPFANQAANIWKGRVSWRTATTYDATQALVEAFKQHPGDRAAVTQLLNQGMTLKKSVTEFNIFNDIPLVKANQGAGGPAGSRYRFDPI